jgi:hypothetical protein
MARKLTFWEVTTAPKDGTAIEVRHGATQKIILATGMSKIEGGYGRMVLAEDIAFGEFVASGSKATL